MVTDTIRPERWYAVDEVAAFIGYERDTVIRRIKDGFLKAFVLPVKQRSRRRVYSSRRVQGSEIIRFLKENTGETAR